MQGRVDHKWDPPFVVSVPDRPCFSTAEFEMNNRERRLVAAGDLERLMHRCPGARGPRPDGEYFSQKPIVVGHQDMLAIQRQCPMRLPTRARHVSKRGYRVGSSVYRTSLFQEYPRMKQAMAVTLNTSALFSLIDLFAASFSAFAA